MIVYKFLYIIAKKLPPTNSRFGKLGGKLRRFCASKMCTFVGKNVNIEQGASFTKDLSIGDRSGVGINCKLYGKVSIGKYVNMGPEVYIYTTNHGYDRIDIPMQQQGYTVEKPVVIEDDVWIGSRVTILPGVHIGQGAIIGASAVVTHDVEPFTIVAGNPAKLIRRRNAAVDKV